MREKRTDKRILKEENLVFEIKLHSKKLRKVIAVRANVRWVKCLYDDEKYEIGFEFVDSPVDVIMNLIDHLYGK
ncbi:MAG: PilZ domain-containing protein [Candidatus Aminicenantes bacterium]|nr:PilZ domain-containing protein [Candidatus Aminicenantes bacterium]